MSSFTRQDYERIIAIARELRAIYENDPEIEEEVGDLGRELFKMAEEVIGQQSPPYDPPGGE